MLTFMIKDFPVCCMQAYVHASNILYEFLRIQKLDMYNLVDEFCN